MDEQKPPYVAPIGPHVFPSPFRALVLTSATCAQFLNSMRAPQEQIAADCIELQQAVAVMLPKPKGKANVPTLTPEQLEQILSRSWDEVQRRVKENSRPFPSYWPLIACWSALDSLKFAQQQRPLKSTDSTINLSLFAQQMLNVAMDMHWRSTAIENSNLFQQYHALLPVKKKADKRADKARDAIEVARKKRDRLRNDSSTYALKCCEDYRKSEAHRNPKNAEVHRWAADQCTKFGYKTADGKDPTEGTVRGWEFKAKRKAKKAAEKLIKK